MARKLVQPRLLVLFALVLLLTMTVVAQQGAKNGEWRIYGGDSGSTRYSPLDSINRDNVKNLKVAWIWRSDNFGAGPEYKPETTPIMVNGVLYFPAGNRRAIVAADGFPRHHCRSDVAGERPRAEIHEVPQGRHHGLRCTHG